MVEHALLIKTYDSAGRSGLTALINQRVADQFFYEWAYLLTDASLIYVAGNLQSWPATLQADQGWANFTAPDLEGETDGAPAAPRDLPGLAGRLSSASRS